MLRHQYVAGRKEIVNKREKYGGGMGQWSGRTEANKNRNIWRQKEKQNQVYMLLKEKPRKKNLDSWKAVMAKISFSK